MITEKHTEIVIHILFLALLFTIVIAIFFMSFVGYRSIYCFNNPTDLACKIRSDSEVRISK